MAKVAHALLGVAKAVGHVVERLVGRDGVRLVARDGRVPRLQLGLRCVDSALRGARILELAERAEQARAVRLDGASLLAEPKLDGEPVAGCQALDVSVRSA